MAVHEIHYGRYYEEFKIGELIRHHWGRTIKDYDSVLFSTMTMNYNPIYFNDEYAKKLGYKGIVVNPLLVYSTVLGLSVEDLSEKGGPFLGIDNVKFFAPVYPGDTIYAVSETLSKRTTKSRPGWGIVEWKTQGFNQNNDLVVEYTRRNLSLLRDSYTTEEGF